jgi:WD40 repeat protein
MYAREYDSFDPEQAIAALKRVFFEQYKKQFQAQIYIPLNIGHSLQDNNALPADAWLEQFCETSEKTHLLFSEGGGGKSSFCYWIAEKLWERHDADPKQPIPLILRVSLQEKLTENTLFDYIKRELLKDPAFLENLDYQIKNLKNMPMVLLLDGFDELPSAKQGNLWRQLALYQWTINKVLITCRPEALIYYDYHRKQDLFKTHMSKDEVEENNHVAYYAQPFTPEQIADYLERYQESEQTEINYQELFNNLPELNAFTSNPYVLYLCAEALPDIIEKIGEKEEKAEVYYSTRLEIYEIFTHKWIKNHAEKLRKTGEISEIQCRTIQKYAHDFCAALAARLWGQEKWVIEYDPTEQSKTVEETKWVQQDRVQLFSAESEFSREVLKEEPPAPQPEKKIWVKFVGASESARDYFSSKHKTTIGNDYSRFFCKNGQFKTDTGEVLGIQLLLRGCPLRYLGEDKGIHRYEFFHKSLLEYFASKQMFRSVSYHAGFSLGCALNDRLLDSQEPLPIRLAADQVKNNVKAQALLRQVVEESKHEPRVAIAAANAMTILNAAGVDFSGENFSRVRIKGANLVGAMCIGTNFTEADLREVEWVGAQLDHADFTRACVSHQSRWKNDGMILSYHPLSQPITGMKLSPNGKWLINIPKHENQIHLLTLDKKLIKTIKMKSTDVSRLYISSNSKFIVVGLSEYPADRLKFARKKIRTIQIWEAATGHNFKSLEELTDDINLVAISPDGTRLILGSENLRLWDIDMAQAGCLQILEKDHFQKHVSFSPDSKTIITFNHNTLKIWDTVNGKLLGSCAEDVGSVSCLTHSPDNKFIVSVESNGLGECIKTRSAESGECLKILTGHTGDVTCIAVSSDSKWIASGSKDKTIKIWDIVSGQCQYTLIGHTERITDVSFKFDGDLVSSSGDRTVRQWNVTSEAQCLKKLEGHTGAVNCVTVFRRGQRWWFISGGQDKTIKKWSISNWQCSQTFRGHEGSVTCVAISPDGSRIVSGSLDKTLRVWNANNAQCLYTLAGHSASIDSVSYSSTGIIISSSRIEPAKLWDADGQCVGTLQIPEFKNPRKHDRVILSKIPCGISSNRRLYAMATEDNMIYLWNTENGKHVKTFNDYDTQFFQASTLHFSCLAFSADNKFIASGNVNKLWTHSFVVSLWNIRTGDCVQKFIGHTKMVTCVCYWPNGKWVLSGSLDNTIKVWDIASGDCLSSKDLHNTVNSITWIGAWRLVVGLQDSLRIYHVDDQGQLCLLHYISQTPILLSADNLVLNNTYGLLHEYRDTEGKVCIEETLAAKLLKRLGGIGSLSRKSCEDILKIRAKAIPYKGPITPLLIIPDCSPMLSPNGNSCIALCYDKMSENPLHAFLLMESIEEGYYRIRRIDAFIDERANKSEALGMAWKGKVHIEETVKTLTDTCELLRTCQYRAFLMGPEQAEKLLTTVAEEIKNPPPYLLMGNHAFFRPLTDFKKGNNCITWCEEKLKQIGLEEALNSCTTWTETFNDRASNNENLSDATSEKKAENSFFKRFL